VCVARARKHANFHDACAWQVHDFFNLLSVIIFMPIEIITGLLNGGDGMLASFSAWG
jgi:hypothetical protein